ncbi:MAG: kelch repeat-containing protein [Blastocatellia bacterium]
MAASAQAEAQSWSLTGSLHTPRYLHTATLLENGKVLVAGGFVGFNFGGELIGDFLNTAELYDPETGAWSFTGNLNTPRAEHTATLLRDGKVLVAGGYDNSAELYDPQTGTWSLTGSLHAPPSYPRATLLQNGKVLVAGYFPGANPVSPAVYAAELYDPETGTWSVTGNPNTRLALPTATLLQNGKVLVVGANSAELYDPGTGTWSSVGRLDRSIRFGYTATLLPDGTVLIAGGLEDLHFAGTVTYDAVELYNPNTGTWSSTGYLNIPRGNHTATLLPDGKVLVVGGFTRIGNGISTPHSSELYDPSTGTWSFTSNPNTPRSDHTATLLADGKVLIVGGCCELGSAELGSNFAAVPPTILRPVISLASVARKNLFVVGENFDSGAVILINGLEQKTRNDSENPQTRLIGKKAGKKKNLKPGDRIQVRNPSGTTSQGFIFTGS